MQVNDFFGTKISKECVRRILQKHELPASGGDGPSWLVFLGNTKDSLWSLDLFRSESIFLKTHWIMVVMDQFSRRIIGFSVHAGAPDGEAVCRMLNGIICGNDLPKRLSTDNDPLFKFCRFKANLRIREAQIEQMMRRLGIADAVKPKLTIMQAIDGGVDLVAKGKAEVGLFNISEILTVQGVALVGPLPASVQNYIVFAAALHAGSRSPGLAQAFVKLATDPASRQQWNAGGLESMSGS
jgi:hypothetical protein